MTPLPPLFLGPAIAHRGYHDLSRGVPENSRAAFEAAINAGYGIELDVQLSRDGRAMVFHDYGLERLTDKSGAVRQRDAEELGSIALKGSGEGIPTLAEVLELVAGRCALLIEIKDQDGAMMTNVGPLERAVADDLRGYAGPVAVMSFNPHAMAAFAKAAPDVPRGLTTCSYQPEDWPLLPKASFEALRDFPSFENLDASFISHRVDDLSRPRVAEVKAGGAHILCWTVRSLEQEVTAREVADNITFEGYAAPLT